MPVHGLRRGVHHRAVGLDAADDGGRVSVTARVCVAMSDRAEGDRSRWIGGADAAL
jgi:hypothetical protein